CRPQHGLKTPAGDRASKTSCPAKIKLVAGSARHNQALLRNIECLVFGSIKIYSEVVEVSN
ncbi:MAG: hypothetical protein LC730_05595, partial [Acidobacteria bacterium]|nr:hypothetical protein [Acidobacteriota bacterium]